MPQPCPIAIDCDCTDSPILNRTAEAADSPILIGECVRCPGDDEPPLGHVWSRRGCRTWALSTVSQEDADAQAALQMSLCGGDNDDGDTTPSEDPWVPTPTVRFGGGPVFASESQGVSCASGNDLVAFITLPANLSISGPTLTVAAGAFSAATQEEANALAASYVTTFMSDGLASGDLECVPAWVFSATGCGSTSAMPSGVSASGFSVDSLPVACQYSTDCQEGLGTTTYRDFTFVATRTIGPYAINRLITVTGTYNIIRVPANNPPPCNDLVPGNSQFTLKLLNVSAYSGDIDKRVAFDTGTSDSGGFTQTGTLLAGNTATVRLFCIALSRSAPTCEVHFDITVTDA